MRLAFLSTLLLLSSAPRPSLHGAQDETTVIVRVGRVYVGDGRILEDVRLHLAKGKISRIELDEGEIEDKGARILDFRRKTLIPGLIAAHTELAAMEARENLSPDLVAADNFDWFQKHPKLLSTGLTTVYLSPGRSRLLPGQGSVVKLGGKEMKGRLLSAHSAMRIQLSPRSRSGIPAIFEPNPSPTGEDPLVPARRQRGSSRSSQLEVLGSAFEEARRVPGNGAGSLGGEGSLASRYDLAPLKQVLAGKLPVRLAAPSAGDILHGVRFLKGLGARIVLEKPDQAVLLGKRLADEDVSVVLSMPVRPSAPMPGDIRKEPDAPVKLTPEVAGELAKSGLRIAVVPASDQDLGRLRLIAGLAARFGLPEHQALMSITLDAARILGVAGRVGSLEIGKDADFVVLSGRPFDARSQVEQVFIEGESVYEAKKKSAPFAIQAGRVLLGDGREIRKALVVVKEGKIEDIGPYASVPPGAKVLSYPDSVLVPGYIAAATRLGLHADSGSRVQATTATDVAAALYPEDPAFAEALRAGVTSLFVTPDDTGAVSGRVAAVKTDGSKEGFLTKAVTGLRMVLSKGGSQGKSQILSAIKKARDYIQPKKPEPKKEEKKPAKAEPEKDEKKEKKPSTGTGLTGSWRGEADLRGRKMSFPIKLEQKGSEVDAEVRLPFGRRGTGLVLKGKLKFEDNKLEGTLEGEIQGRKITAKITAEYKDDKLQGTIQPSFPPISIPFTATRGGTPATPESPPETKSPKKVEKKKKNEALEPFRPILAGEAPLVVKCSNRDAVLAAIEAVVKESKLRLVVTGAALELAKKPIKLPKDSHIGYLLGVQEVSYEEKGEKTNLAEVLSDMGFDVALVSRVQKGTAFLPIHAAWAVSEGFHPRRALASLTGNPARSFGLEGRIGLLAPGRDADMVLLSGDPFDLPTRVQRVWVNGRLRLDNLEEGTKKGTSTGKGPEEDR